MRRLIIENATEALSLALFEDAVCIAASDAQIGRGHAERLIPAIAGMPDGGRADEIWVDRGPGSFTGVRIGIAAARALGLAWGARVRGFALGDIIAASARAVDQRLVSEVFAIAIEGGHGEWLVGTAIADTPVALAAMTPAAACATISQPIVVGSRAEDCVALRGVGQALAIVPRARHALTMPAIAVDDRVAPEYPRAPDAQPHDGRVLPV